MRKILQIYLLLVMGWLVTSCDSFLKEYSQDLAYANSIHDLSELLIGDGYAVTDDALLQRDADMGYIHLMDDDIEFMLFSDLYSSVPNFGFHYWAANPYKDEISETDDPVWKWMYKRISTLNIVLAKVEDFKADDEEGYRRVKGEAHFLRGFYYFVLVNLYAKPYVRESAQQEPGIPLKLTEYVEDNYYSRASVEEVYQSIVSDLKRAADCLKGIEQPSLYRANVTATHALLGRIYLYMTEWELALEQCDEALKGNYGFMNLNTALSNVSFVNSESPEVIFSMGKSILQNSLMIYSDYDERAYIASSDLMEMYDKNDLRLRFAFKEHPLAAVMGCDKLKEEDTKTVSDHFSIRLPEVYLNKAEACAMLDKGTDAVAALKLLRQNRFENGEVGDVNKQGEDLVNLIRDERRRELCFEGHRWFDLRRYAVYPKYPMMKEIRHPYYEYDQNQYEVQYRGYYRLKPYSEDNAYVLPIPNYAIIFNNGMLKPNAERENRMLEN